MVKENRKLIKIFLFMLFFMLVSSIIADEVEIKFANETEWDDVTTERIQNDYLAGAFAPIVGIGGSPLIALTILSGVGCYLTFFPDSYLGNFQMIRLARDLPIADLWVFGILLLVTIVKFVLRCWASLKTLSKATIEKIEIFIGYISSVGFVFYVVSVTKAFYPETMTMNIANVTSDTFFSNSINFAYLCIILVYMGLAFSIFLVVKTMVNALDILAFLLSPIPLSTALFNIAQHIIWILFWVIVVISPPVAIIIGLFLVFIACLVFRAARRLELYYRKIYLIPFIHVLFRREKSIPLIPKKLPRGVKAEFSEVELCLEGFFMNRTSSLYKREICYFITSEGKNYIYKKRFFGKVIKFEIPDESFIEKSTFFKVLTIFSDETLKVKKRRAHFEGSPEYGKDIVEIISKTGLIDYEAIRKERWQKKRKDIELKVQQTKDQTSEKITSTVEKVKGAFESRFFPRQKPE